MKQVIFFMGTPEDVMALNRGKHKLILVQEEKVNEDFPNDNNKVTKMQIPTDPKPAGLGEGEMAHHAERSRHVDAIFADTASASTIIIPIARDYDKTRSINDKPDPSQILTNDGFVPLCRSVTSESEAKVIRLLAIKQLIAASIKTTNATSFVAHTIQDINKILNPPKPKPAPVKFAASAAASVVDSKSSFAYAAVPTDGVVEIEMSTPQPYQAADLGLDKDPFADAENEGYVQDSATAAGYGMVPATPAAANASGGGLFAKKPAQQPASSWNFLSCLTKCCP